MGGKTKERVIVAIAKLKEGDTSTALQFLEKLLEREEKRKPRQPTDFNRFVRETMIELKGANTIPPKERLKECGRRWRALKQSCPSVAPASTDERTPSCAH